MAFTKLENTRDLGGMRTSDGRSIKSGLLFRSGHLSELDPADADALRALVRTVVDFRTDGEMAEQPDTVIPGITYLHIPIVDSLTAGISREETSDRTVIQMLVEKPQEAREYMCGLYRGFVSDFCVQQYARFIKLLADAEGGFLWHCTAGKDRAGIASVIVEGILGVPGDVIRADYLATNEHLKENIRGLTAYVKEKAGADSETADEALWYLFGAKEEYLEAFYGAVSERYGSFDGFLRDALGVTEETAAALKGKYLE